MTCPDLSNITIVVNVFQEILALTGVHIVSSMRLIAH